jgi:aldose 1-epimerase
MPYLLKDVALDDGYVLEKNSIEFTTPQYVMRIKSSAKDNFLQLYTPSDPNKIAIEPMTGVCDSFNNKMGLQVIHPHEQFDLEWDVSFTKTTQKKHY